jgi:hypothetical protein
MPQPDELKELLELYNGARTEYAAKPEEAAKIALSPSKPAKDEKEKDVRENDPNVIELAAWTAVANVLLNLDETLMKP